MKEYWITNISNKNIGLYDLNLYVKPFTTIKLNDLNIDQIEKSITTGSIYKKRKSIFVRKNIPEQENKFIPFLLEAAMPSRERSCLNMKQENYEELNVSDEEFAADSIDTIEIDENLKIKKV